MRKKHTSGSIDLRQRALQAQFTRTLSYYTMTQNRRNANHSAHFPHKFSPF
jgi:hypothetical protein